MFRVGRPMELIMTLDLFLLRHTDFSYTFPSSRSPGKHLNSLHLRDPDFGQAIQSMSVG